MEEQFCFGPFRCDPSNACVWQGERAVALTPKAFNVLLHLLRHPGQLVNKDELLKAVWPETYVGDAVLKVSVGEIRKALGDDAKTPQFIETVHRRGYRFLSTVTAQPIPSFKFQVSSSEPQHSALNTRYAVLVGRDAELAQLHGLLAKALNGERHVVFVTGEPGIGKTSLIEEFLTRVRREPGLALARGQCLEHYGSGEAYLPVLDAFGRLSREPGRERVVKLLERYAPTWLIQMPALVDSAERERLRHEVLGATPERMLREMAEAIEAFTAETPLALVVEDLHWSDYATLDLIAALARRREPARLLVIGTYRPVDLIVSAHPLKSLKQELQGHGQCQEVPLDLLTASEVAAYLEIRFPGSTLPEELALVTHRRTDGNPLFLVNFVEYLIAQGLVYQHEGRWGLHGNIRQIEEGMPESIRQMLERHIERLTPDEQRVLEAASVAGVEFAAAIVAAALKTSEGTVEECCDQLARQEQFLRVREPVAWPDGTVTASYGFTHSLYQHALLQRVATVRRLRCHLRMVERLETAYGARADELAVELAIHCEQGRDYARAIHYLQRAAEQAARHSANRETRQYLTRALEMIGQVPDAEQATLRLALLDQRGRVSRAMGDMPRAAEDFSALAAYAREVGLIEQEVKAFSELATALSWIDREKCLAADQQASTLSQDLTNEVLRTYVRSHAAYWHLLWRGWRPDDIQACAQAVSLARQIDDRAQLGVQLARFCFFLCLQSDYRAACQAAAEGLQLTREAGDVHNYLLCHIFSTRALLLLGRWGEALRVLRESSDMAVRNGHQRWAVLLRLNEARVHEEAGDFVWARDAGAYGIEQGRAMPLPYAQLVGSVVLGFAQLGLGQARQAFESFNHLDRRLEQEHLLMDWIWQIPLRLGFSEYCLRQGEFPRARQEAERLCALAAQPGEHTYLALGRRMLAETAMAQREWEEAEKAVTLALAGLDGVEAPLAEWRVAATAAQLAEQRRRKAEARRYWSRSASVIQRLADSFERGDPLRQTFLTQPLVQKVLTSCDKQIR
jgi:DNA-binding winged helix-turn-helix (wHTH) protein/tetratricopeptide (TPR) repeat protein